MAGQREALWETRETSRHRDGREKRVDDGKTSMERD